jgi:hypothetical protein
MKVLVLVLAAAIVILQKPLPDPVKELWDSTQLAGNCYSYGPNTEAGGPDGQCKNGESMYMRGAVAPQIPVRLATTPWPGCKSGPLPPNNPNENDVMGILDALGLKNRPTAVANCVAPSVPFPTGKTITRINLTVIVNSLHAGTCGPEFHVGSDNAVIRPKEGDLHKCGRMFARAENTPFDNCGWSTPIIANNRVSAVFFNWAGDDRVGMIRVYYK